MIMPKRSAAVIGARLPVAAVELQHLAAAHRLAAVQHLAGLHLAAAQRPAALRLAACPERPRAAPPFVRRPRRHALRHRRSVRRRHHPVRQHRRLALRHPPSARRRRPSGQRRLRVAPADFPVQRSAAVFPAATSLPREVPATALRGLRLPLATVAVPAVVSRVEIPRGVKRAVPAGSAERLRVACLAGSQHPAVWKLPVESRYLIVKRRLPAPRVLPTPPLAATSRTHAVA